MLVKAIKICRKHRNVVLGHSKHVNCEHRIQFAATLHASNYPPNIIPPANKQPEKTLIKTQFTC
jgi:hypothetical protein